MTKATQLAKFDQLLSEYAARARGRILADIPHSRLTQNAAAEAEALHELRSWVERSLVDRVSLYALQEEWANLHKGTFSDAERAVAFEFVEWVQQREKS